MARKHLKTNSQTLTLTLDGNEITAEKFVKSVSAFLSITRDVTECVFRTIMNTISGRIVNAIPD